jgi:hypothetical protein
MLEWLHGEHTQYGSRAHPQMTRRQSDPQSTIREWGSREAVKPSKIGPGVPEMGVPPVQHARASVYPGSGNGDKKCLERDDFQWKPRVSWIIE